jgi:rod shape-determining protein MreC
MRNIFLFIQRYFVLLCFLVLQAVALYMLFQYNRYHKAAFSGVAHELTGRINKQVDKVDDYFHLREENRRVHQMNDSLINLLRSNFANTDTSVKLVTDSLKINDTTKSVRRYYWRPAKVVYGTTGFEKNYIQLNSGSNQGVADNMAVLSSNGTLVGLVVNVSPNFSQVMTLLHTQSQVQASLKNSNVFGKLEWDTKDPRFVFLKGISRDVEVKRGDSVLTSIYSYNYPPGFLIGTIASISTDKASGFYLLKVKTATNFSALQQVFVVENLQRIEQVKLDEDTRKKMDQQKK